MEDQSLKTKIKATDRIFGYFPCFFTRKRAIITQKFEQAITKRVEIVKSRMGIDDLSAPKIKISLSKSHTFYSSGYIHVSYTTFLSDPEKLVRTLDHEIGHHIQHTKNPHIKQAYCLNFFSWFYWCFTGKMRGELSKRAFREGFATYVAWLTTGDTSPRLSRGQELLVKGRKTLLRKDFDIVPYVLGFMSYCSLANASSEKNAIKIGLSSKTSHWVKAVEKVVSAIEPDNEQKLVC